MELDEIRKVLTALRVNYPHSYSNYTDEETTDLLKLWYASFKNYPTKVVKEAVMEIITTDTRDFAPNIAMVKTKIHERQIKSFNMIECDEIWNIAIQFVRNKLHLSYLSESKSEYEKLPEEVKANFTFDEIVQMGKNSPEDNQRFTKPQFEKRYKQQRSNLLALSLQYNALPTAEQLLGYMPTGKQAIEYAKPEPLQIEEVNYRPEQKEN
nr:MAG TPA: replisome organizer [Caudoviricetes sp.]